MLNDHNLYPYPIKQLVSIFFLFFLFGVCPIKHENQSKLIQVANNKKPVYVPYTSEGDILPDFSHCGYGGGGVKIPEVAAVITLEAIISSEDDLPRIQAAIDKIGQLPKDARGFRGALLLRKGIYKLNGTLKIRHDGIVLRGEEGDEGTTLLAVQSRQHTLIEVGTRSDLREIQGTRQAITDGYVPSGSYTFTVEDGSGYTPGDPVIIHRPSTKKWIADIGMNRIPPRYQPVTQHLRPGETIDELRKRTKVNEEGTLVNTTTQWKPSSKDLLYERKITAIKGNTITIDVPLVNALQQEYGGGYIYKYELPGRIAQVGIENLQGEALFDSTVVKENEYIGKYFADEQHGWNFIVFHAVENAWARNISTEHFHDCVVATRWCKYLTVQDARSVNPIATITGGRRSPYSVSGQMCLFQRCYASHARHDFVLGASVAGPNAFVDCQGEMSFSSSEPHQRWATGCLWDNVSVAGPEASLLAVNRGYWGTGHGWSGAQMVFWNCSAPIIMVMKPPTAQNFVIGNMDRVNDPWSGNFDKTISSVNNVSSSSFEYNDVPVIGNGYIESPDARVYPYSLYYYQLYYRLGAQALENVITEDQKARFFNNEKIK